MPIVSIDMSEELLQRLDDTARQTGESKEALVLDATEGLLDHWDEMFSSIKEMMEKNPNMSMDELEAAWKMKHDIEDEDEDHVHDGKGCCTVHG